VAALNLITQRYPTRVDLFQKAYDFTRADEVKEAGYYPYFRAIEENEGPVVQIEGRKIIMAGSNNYLGLTADPRVKEAAIKAIERYGTGCSGSRYLTGPVRLHEEMEAEMADFFGKEACLLFSTGYQTAQGVIPALCQRGDYVISDRDNHACIVAGNLMAKGMYGEVVRYIHGDMNDLERRLSKLPVDAPKLMVTDGVFSTSGEIVELPKMIELAARYNCRIMVDDAHSVGVIGEGGRGTASYFNLVKETDMTMGTFSKTFASLGGFVVGEERVINFIKHTSPALIFSASPTPASVAAGLEALRNLRAEPERIKRLIDNADYMRDNFKAMGFKIIESKTGIVPVIVGDDIKAFVFWRKLFDAGVFVNAFISPGVMQGMQMMRTSYMATHEKQHLDRILELFKEIGEELGVLDEEESLAADADQTRAAADAEVAAVAKKLEPLRKAEHIKIRKVDGRKDKLKFIRLPWDLYQEEKNWVPPLEMDRMRLIDEQKNPFYKHAEIAMFLAEDERGATVGRIAAIVNHRHNQIYRDNLGFIGFFDSVDDQQVANSLFAEAENWLRTKGLKMARGPVSPSINDEVGLLVEGFEYAPSVMMPYHPPYYQTLWEHAGYGKTKDLLAWTIPQSTALSPKLLRVTDMMRERTKVRLRTLDMKNFDKEVSLIRDLYERGWEENWGAVPLTSEEIGMLAGELKQIIDPDYILFAELDVDGETKTIGFSLVVPDINQAFKAGKPIPKGTMNLPTAISNLMTKKKEIDTLRIILLGVMPEYRNRGIDALIYREIMERSRKKGIKYGEASWVLEDNVMMSRAAQMMNGTPTKRYRVFDKPLYQGEENAGSLM
jgi:8-amino-7-oxononanoate synthase